MGGGALTSVPRHFQRSPRGRDKKKEKEEKKQQKALEKARKKEEKDEKKATGRLRMDGMVDAQGAGGRAGARAFPPGTPTHHSTCGGQQKAAVTAWRRKEPLW